MIKKIFLIYRTVRHLKLTQIIYQVYYRLKPVKTLNAYDLGSDLEIAFKPINFYIYPTPEQANKNLKFSFLNLTHQFSSVIDWNYQELGKLWNYNLQYFNYLHQVNLDDRTKTIWLKEIGSCLRKGTLKLEPYPVSLRIMNTIRYLSKNTGQDQQILSDIYAQTKYLYQNIEYHLLGNHLLENAFALMMGGYSFSEKEWMQKSKKILYRELNEQLLKDGGHFELSPMYHQIILFRMLELIEWYGKSDQPDQEFLEFIRQKTKLMLSWLSEITYINGDVPHFNDSTNGIARSSSELFEYAKIVGVNDFLPAKLNDSGYRKFSNNIYECIVDVGPVGASYQPGHSHADALSFILYHRGRPFLMEAGTSTYQVGEKRNYERSTNAHNTVVIGGVNQSEVWGGFRVGRRANVFVESESFSHVNAYHDGYTHNFGVLHNRHFNFDKDFISIVDKTGDKKGKAILHFHPDCNIEKISPKKILIDQFAEISIKGANEILLSSYEYASGYNQYRQAVRVEIDFNQQVETFIKFQ